MSNITVTHSASGLVQAEVVRAERITPHMMRVTFGGDDLARFEFRGFDQWFRLALPVRGEEALARLPHRFGMGGTLKWLAMGKEHRPVIRNYTVRDFRPEVRELDVDFVVHGDDGIAGPWAQRAEPGERALPFLRELELPDGVPYAFVVGEQALASGARRHLVKDRGIDRRQVTFSGYWKRGSATIG